MYNKMNFTALDDIAAQMDKYGVNGDVDLMNGLDESILNAIGTKSSFCGESYSGADATYVKSNTSRTKSFQKYANAKGYTPKLVEDGIWGSKTQAAWDKFGDEFVKAAQDIINKVTTSTISEADVVKQEYEKSGSKRPFLDWLNSDRGRDTVNTAAQIANIFLSGQQQNQQQQQQQQQQQDSDKEDSGFKKTETTILGMSPITFAVVSLGVVAVISIIAIKVIKSKK